MAAQEDIIIIEDNEAAALDNDSSNEKISQEEDDSKLKKIIIFGGAGAAVVLVALIVALLVLKSSKEENKVSMDFIEEKLDKNNTKPIEPSKLENMIAKANYLYTSGSKEEALFLYEKIAIYSEAISLYNLGVAQLKNKQYKIALQTFQKAIQNDEKRCVSAINAAVCSLYLEDQESFKYYIELAYAYLPHEINSPLYSYYYALINYYNNNYLEALSALKNKTSDNYPEVQKHLSARINALFGNNYDAIESLENDFSDSDAFSIGLLYARVGDITLAVKHLEDAIIQNNQPIGAQLALGLINLKAGRVASGAKEIKNVTDMFPEEVYKYYPIQVKLRESLFQPQEAQKQYRDKIVNSRLLNYQKIFYFSPYKVFNASQTLSYIKKGTANIFIDNIDSAEDYLKQSASSSVVNLGIAKAIKKALQFKIREANDDLQKLVAVQPKHSILHYNLALTYAQMGNMTDAYTHFLRAYHLDAKNYLAGVFAVMTGQLTNKDNTKLTSIIKDSITEEELSEETDLYKTLLRISDKDALSAIDWLDNNYQQRPLYLALDIIIALKLNKSENAKKAAQKLTIMLPNDILPHMMYIDSNFYDLPPEEYASKVLNYLKIQNFHYKDLYFGPSITAYLFIQQNLITGKLYFLRDQLRDILASTKEDTQEITSALALASLYDRAYEESYSLYNYLIDDLKVRDANTLFLGAVASTAAGHHENAIALLELAKMKDTNFVESRYALGLLYLEVQNNQGAVIQFSKIGDNGFRSEYFDFEIDLDKLVFEKQNPQI